MTQGGIPFELYIKDSFARSKRASQALCLSILDADFERSKAQPQAMSLGYHGSLRIQLGPSKWWWFLRPGAPQNR